MSFRNFAGGGAALLIAVAAGPAAAQSVYLGIGSGLDGAGDLYGHGVAQLHDVDGDGIHEIAIGAPGNDDNGTDAGAVFVVNGVYGTLVYQVKGTVGDELGWSVANLGDVTGDGIDDFITGRPGRDFNGSDAGAVSAYSGATGLILWTQIGVKAGGRLGSCVAGVGDVDGDGYGDVLAGAPGYDGPTPILDANWGRASLYSGDNGLPLETYLGTAANDNLGSAVAGLPDLNGDGFPEFAIGVPGKEIGSPFSIVNAGTCEVYSGKTHALLFSVNGSGGNEACGSSIAALGDTDHDGQQEFVVGRPGWASERGRVTVHEGKTGTLIQTLNGPQLSPADQYGTAVCAAGDVNKDGHVDLLVGAPSSGTGFGGWSHVISGKDWSQYKTAYNSYADWGFGSVIAAGIDTTDDGWPDAAYGMPLAPVQGADSGYLWAYHYLHYQPNILFQGPGTAALSMYGTEMYSGGVVDLRVSGAPAFTTVYLFASAAEQPVPFKGGVLVPQLATALLITLQTDVKGRVTITNIPGGNGYQIVFLQALLPYAGAPQGWWITNAVAAALLP